MIGTRILGTVDRIPGIGCVKTKFFALIGIPIFPLGSYFVFEGTEKPSFAFYGLAFSLGTKMRGIEVPLNLRSALYGYIGGVISYIALLMGGLIVLLLFNDRTSAEETTILTITIPIEILFILLLVASSRFNVANNERKERILWRLRNAVIQQNIALNIGDRMQAAKEQIFLDNPNAQHPMSDNDLINLFHKHYPKGELLKCKFYLEKLLQEHPQSLYREFATERLAEIDHKIGHGKPIVDTLQTPKSEQNGFSSRMLCPDETCIGVINETGVCGVCGLSYNDGTVLKNEERYFAEAITYYTEGKYDEAIASLTNAIAINPNGAPHYYITRGNAYCREKHYNTALEDFNKAIALAPEAAGAYLDRGQTFHEMQLYDRALEDYNKAVDLAPSNANSFFFRAVTYFSKEEYAKVIEDINKSISLNLGTAQLAQAYTLRGLSYSKQGENKNAVQDLVTGSKLGDQTAARILNEVSKGDK